jgi:DNA-binding CsgD family transcriptional regulator/PAS domain-containing protein
VAPEAGSTGPVPLVARAATAELSRAVMACDFPLVVWSYETQRVVLANQPAADLVGTRVAELVGRAMADLVQERGALRQTVALLRAADADAVHVRRRLVRADGGTVAASVWTRTAEVDGRRMGITLVIGDADLPRLGRNPERSWRDLACVAIGAADARWVILRVSADVSALLDRSPSDLVGLSLLDLVNPDDVDRFPGAPRSPLADVMGGCRVRIRDGRGGWTEVCVLAAPAAAGQPFAKVFALVGSSEPPTPADRAAELEVRLRRIGAEVRAAGVLDTVHDFAAPTDFAEFDELTARQWEVLSRLVRGERVATIAAALFVSPSTVRNHLAAIFAKFGVHSQAELLEVLRRRRSQLQRSM